RGDAAVAVRVQVDEPGADHQPGRVDLLRPVDLPDRPDGDDLLALDVQVALHAGVAGAVVEGGVAEDDVGVRLRGTCGNGEGRERKRSEAAGHRGPPDAEVRAVPELM